MTDKSILSRYTEVFLFVAVYIGVGLALKPDPNVYLFIGIPLTLLFQLLIRREPLQTLWVREYHRFSLSRWGLLIAFALMIYPVKQIISKGMSHHLTPVFCCFMVAVMAGAVGAGYSLCYFKRDTWRYFSLCLLIGGGVGVSIMVSFAVIRAHMMHQSLYPNVPTGLSSLATYFPISFILEEVVFRGLLDSHIHPKPESRGILSAMFVSALWGLWHIPVALHRGDKNAVAIVAMLLFTHTVIGVPLSIFWRRSGNLAVPAFSHAFIDAVRNSLIPG